MVDQMARRESIGLLVRRTIGIRGCRNVVIDAEVGQECPTYFAGVWRCLSPG